ncbi:MAG: DUF1232 domain-containing protein [Gemmatimonadaceae bacterium]|nr:DUF1232 domain-containing protein [Gemmatimonadaceae bacterium]
METSRLAQMARDRLDDRESGRPERGFFTGRGRSRRSEPSRYDRYPDTDEMSAIDGRESDDEDIEPGPRPRVGAKRSVLHVIRKIPAYVRLLLGLMSDSRVSRIDRFLVVAAAAYIISPLDFIPDFVPFLGEVDDIFLLMLALQRLVENTGRRVLMDYWRGDPDDLSDVNLAGMVSAAGFFLPAGIRRRLTRMARRSRR